MDAFLIIVAQQWYELKSTSGFTVSNCSEQQVNSLLSCAAIGRAAKCVTYYFNVDEYLCLWNCKFFENNSPADEIHEWREYGKFRQFKSFSLNINLLITSEISSLFDN